MDTPRDSPSTSAERPSHTRQPSRQPSSHVPINPSQLREVYVPSEGSASPENTTRHPPTQQEHAHAGPSTGLEFSGDGIHPAPDHASVHSGDDEVPSGQPRGIVESELEPTARTRLLNHNWDAGSCCGSEHCNHGTMSPRPWSVRSYGTINSSMSRTGFGGPYPGGAGEGTDAGQGLLGDAGAEGLLRGGKASKRKTTKYLAERHGIRNQKMM